MKSVRRPPRLKKQLLELIQEINLIMGISKNYRFKAWRGAKRLPKL
jgi:hypothetical protein